MALPPITMVQRLGLLIVTLCIGGVVAARFGFVGVRGAAAVRIRSRNAAAAAWSGVCLFSAFICTTGSLGGVSLVGRLVLGRGAWA